MGLTLQRKHSVEERPHCTRDLKKIRKTENWGVKGPICYFCFGSGNTVLAIIVSFVVLLVLSTHFSRILGLLASCQGGKYGVS